MFLDILTRATVPLPRDAVSVIESFYFDKRGYSLAALEVIRCLGATSRKRIVVELWYRDLWKRDPSLVNFVSPAWPLRTTFPTYFNQGHEAAAIRVAARRGVVQLPEEASHVSNDFDKWNERAWPLNLA